MQSLTIMEALPPNCTQLGLGDESGEFYAPPTTHLIATVEDLTNMLDYASKDIDDMDAAAEPSQVPPVMGRWTATSAYDVTWWTLLIKRTTRITQAPMRTNPSINHQSIDVSGRGGHKNR